MMKREIKIGITGIAALVLLFFGMNFLKGMKVFSGSDRYYIVFPDAKGLAKSSTVYADGFNIGIVSNVSYNYNRPGQVVVEISVNRNVKLPHKTVAVLDEAMLGGCTLNLTMGPNPADRYLQGDTLTGSAADGLMASVTSAIPQVEAVLGHIDSLILKLNTLAADPNLPQIMQNAEQLTASLNESSKQLNRLLKNDMPQLASTFNQAGENVVQLTNNLTALDLQSTLDKVNTTMSHLEAASNKLNTPDNSMGLLLNDTLLYGNLNTTVNSATNLLEDLKENPQRYVHFSLFGKKTK